MEALMAVNPTKEAPFDADGNLMGYVGKYYDETKLTWRVVEPFRATIRVIDMYSGRSAKGFIVEDDEGHHYQMFTTDMLELLTNAEVRASTYRGVVFDGIWAISKRGQNWGLKWLSPEGSS